MPSASERSTGSPIGRVPYDILREIFMHCLPQQQCRGRTVQPNTAIAPLLLCHVCSSWRTVALTAAILWTNLSYSFRILSSRRRDNTTYFCENSSKYFARKMEFVRWWRTNQGCVAPSFHFYTWECCATIHITGTKADEIDYGHHVTLDGMDFLLDSITSAQFLDVQDFFWSKIKQRITEGHRVVFPNLHTLLVGYQLHLDDPSFPALSLLPNHAFPALRRLSIGQPSSNSDMDAPLEDFKILGQWSMPTLTHILVQASISLEFWFSCIRAVPNLQWGYFSIDCVSSVGYTMSRECTLPQLATLYVQVHNNLPESFEFPLSLLFSDLHLPTLHTLSLSLECAKERWKDHHAITELYSVLKSTPAIRTLSLECGFLSLRDKRTPEILSALEHVEPIWLHAPQLVNLQFHLLITPYLLYGIGEKGMKRLIRERVEHFFCNIFLDDAGWLDLRNAACPIQSITIDERDIKNMLLSCIEKNFEEAPKIVIQTTEEWAVGLASDMRMGWGGGN